MTTTDIVPAAHNAEITTVAEAGSAAIARAVEQMAGAHKLAQALASTAFVPAHFRGKPDDVAAAIMYGAAIGMDPMASLRAIYVVNGNPGMYARQMVALVQAAGHQVWTEESTDDAVTVCGQRRGVQHVERSTWTIERANKAGYVPVTDPKTGKFATNANGKVIGNEKYLTDPQSMLWARAASDVARRLAPDALAGLDTSVEELQVMDGDTVTTTVTEQRESAADALAAAPPTESAPDMVTSAQLKKIGAAMRDLGMTDRNLALEYVSGVIGHTIASRNELTKDEAGQVIDDLEGRSTDTGDDVHDAEVVDVQLPENNFSGDRDE